ncbi:MAG: hypothetical protein QNJ03_04240 [Dinoroseobacter sp.]|nr:hypothetical protein [Dinoroseobacter sp.]
MIDVRPDPKHPRGGYAVLSFDGSSLTDNAAPLEVFDLYNERFLGPKGWQPEKHAFGPYPVVMSAHGASLVIGPEVVDQIEEFAALRLTIGAVSAEISWPDDIVHAPNAATSDNAIKVGSGPAATTPAAPIKMKDQVSDSDPEPVEQVPEVSIGAEDVADEVDETPQPMQEEEEPSGHSKSLIFGAVAGILALAGLAFFLLQDRDPRTEPVAEPEAPLAANPPPVAAAPDPCSDAELAAVSSDGFEALTGALRNCGGSVGPDTALGLIEKAVAEGDAAALAFFGTLYDTGQTDPVIEEQIGLTLGDNPARAAEYYTRARDAGSSEAEALLAGVCRSLMLRSDTLSVGALEDYCAE